MCLFKAVFFYLFNKGIKYHSIFGVEFSLLYQFSEQL